MSSPSKLTILAFDKDTPSSSPVDSYEAQVNPSSYSVNINVCYNTAGAIGNAGTETKYKGMKPRTMNFELLFDGTGVIESDLETPFNVAKELEKFESVTCAYEGSIDRPHYLLISWGSVTPFPCVLTSLSITYKLFDTEGNPIRALANVTFTSAESASQTAKKANNQSPDLTHMLTVRAGDKLPQLSTKIYGNPGYYLEVAKHNSIVNIRNLRSGQQIKFPPLN